MIKALKLTLSALLIILCSWMIINAAKIALADISHYPIKYFIERLKPTDLPEISTLKKLQTKIQYSIYLRPNNAEYLEYIARIYYLMALKQRRARTVESKIASEKSFRSALEAHIKATRLRPKWPYSWANIALVKSRLKEFDQQYLDAIDYAVQNGPWEIASNNAVSQAGLNGWHTLDNNFKAKTIAALERVYQQRQSTAIEILNHYHRLKEVCSLIKNENFLKEEGCEL
jgi:hypothetical protein